PDSLRGGERGLSCRDSARRRHCVSAAHGPDWHADHRPRPSMGGQSQRTRFPQRVATLLALCGVTPNVCPPRQPQKKGYVERVIKSYQTECIRRDQPSTEEAAREVTEAYLTHYHNERPHQGRSLRNLPPRMAFPTLPQRPPLPEVVDPDRWL